MASDDDPQPPAWLAASLPVFLPDSEHSRPSVTLIGVDGDGNDWDLAGPGGLVNQLTSIRVDGAPDRVDRVVWFVEGGTVGPPAVWLDVRSPDDLAAFPHADRLVAGRWRITAHLWQTRQVVAVVSGWVHIVGDDAE